MNIISLFKIIKGHTIFKIFILIISLLLTACSHIPDENIKDLSGQVLIKSLGPELEKIIQNKSPILPPEQSSYPIIQKIPGPSFNLAKTNQNPISFDEAGNIQLDPGDYAIPVMTYCMNQSRNSPDGHIYSLSKMQGKRTEIIRKLQLNALSKFSFEDIQITLWSIQAGLSYEEMTIESQKIIDENIPEFKSELKESLLKSLEKKWNNIADKSHGMVPGFNQSIDDLLGELGDTGNQIKEIRDFKKM